MGSRILYYGVIVPISLLPHVLLYAFSDVVFFIMYYLVGYRKKVVLKNIENSFPEKSNREHEQIARKFFRHLCDLILESLKGFTISKRQLDKRFKVRNPEMLDAFFAQGKGLVMIGGHYNNWEILALGLGYQIKHLPIGIYKKLSNPFFNEKMKQTREKGRLVMVPTHEAKASFDKEYGEPTAIIFGIDQNPSNPARCYWTMFLNQETPVSFGAEKYAKEYDRPVIYGQIHKMKRGYYETELVLISESPRDEPHGAIMEKGTRELERMIMEQPEYWLWSHKRWKATKPEGVVVHGKAEEKSSSLS